MLPVKTGPLYGKEDGSMPGPPLCCKTTTVGLCECVRLVDISAWKITGETTFRRVIKILARIENILIVFCPLTFQMVLPASRNPDPDTAQT